MIEEEKSLPWDSLALTGALWLFSLFIGLDFPLKIIAFIGLLIAGLLMAIIYKSKPDSIFSAALWDFKTARNGILLAAVLSIALATFSRIDDGLPAIPKEIGSFVLVAVLIGFMEEVVFRGMVQGGARHWSAIGAIVIASVSHAGYKALLFVFPFQHLNNSPAELFVYTLVAGLFLGYSRYITGSLWPAIVAHGCFDLWLYMEQSSAPWWVW